MAIAILAAKVFRMFPNRYSGQCSCGTRVPAGAGFAAKKNGRWVTLCNSAACHRSFNGGSAPAAVSSTKTLTLEDGVGVVRMPYDAGATPLLRSLPLVPGRKSNWDADRKVWLADLSAGNVARVLDIASRLGLEVAPEIAAMASAPVAPEAEERAATAGLFPYQRDGVRFLASHPRALLADEQGLGKTIQALVALPEGAPVLIIAPACVQYNWRDEAAKWRPEFKVSILKGKKSFRAPAAGEIVIVTWAVLPASPPAFLDGTVLIDDEAHFAKSAKALRSKRFRALAQSATVVWQLTGTPLPNKPFDLYGVLNNGDMAVLGGFMSFLRLFNGYKNRWGGYEFGEPEPEVAERLKNVMLRRLKKDVLKDLPAKTYSQVVVNGLSKTLSKTLDSYENEWGETLEEGSLPSFEEFSAIRKELAESRIPAAIEWVESYEEAGEPVVVFSAHREPVLQLGARDGWASITGDVSAQARADIVRRFQAGELKGVALTIAAGGVGITLTRAHTELFIDMAWNPSDNVQAEDRCHRIGQANNVHIVRMVSNHPLDLRVQALIARKIALIAATVDGTGVAYKAKPGIRLEEETDEEREERMAARQAEIEEAARQAEREESQGWLESRRAGLLARAGRPCTIAMSPVKVAAIHSAMAKMVGQCDGAKERDNVGFNKPDASVAHHLFRVGMESESDLRLAAAILSRYPGQVGNYLDIIFLES